MSLIATSNKKPFMPLIDDCNKKLFGMFLIATSNKKPFSMPLIDDCNTVTRSFLVCL